MPRTLAQNAQYIAETIKPAIKSAIEAQGVTVPSTDSFLDYADRIGEIEGGGSGYQLKDLPTGAISTVNDAAELPLNALKVSVEAVQDLHGYDKPWVGGAGKNLLPMTEDGIKAANTSGTWSEDTYTVNGVSFTINTDDGGNITSIKVNGVTTTTNARLELSQVENMSGNILNGCPQGGSSSGYKLRLANLNDAPIGEDIGSGYTLTTNSIYRVSINVGKNTSASNLMFYPMIRLSSADATFAPYSNICPISGWDSGEITVCDDIDNPTQTETITLDFPQTIYGAEWNVVDGRLSVTDGYIASYNGETLPSTWISDRDVYASGTTPTIGAEVVYKLATPTTIPQQAESIRMLEGVNNLYADCGSVVSGEYFVDEGAIDVRKVDYSIGSNTALKISDGRILQGFANMANYHSRPLDASGNWLDVDWSKSFEIGVAFKMTEYPGSNASQYIFGNGTNDLGYRFRTPRVYFSDYWQSLLLDLSLDGSTWYMDASVNFKPVLNTWYFIRLKFDSSTLRITLDITTDFETYTTLHTEVLSSGLYHNGSAIGIGGDQPTASDSTTDSFMIDTFNTYIKGDGVNWGAFTGAFPS